MSDASIPLGVKPIQIESPLDVAQRGLGLQGLAQGIQLNRARLDEERVKADNLRRDQQDESTIQNEMMNPAHRDADGKLDWDKLTGAVQGKVRSSSLQKLANERNTAVESLLRQANEKRVGQQMDIQKLDSEHKFIGQLLQGIDQLPDDQKPAFYANGLTQLQSRGVDVSKLPPTIPGDGSYNEQLRAMAGQNGVLAAFTGDALKKAQINQREEASARAEKQAQAIEDKDLSDQRQRQSERAARTHLGVTNQEQHNAWLKGLDPSIAAEYANLKTFSPEAKTAIQGMGLTAEQRARNAISATDKSTSPIEVALGWAQAKYPNASKAQIYDAALSRLSQTIKDEKIPPGTTGGNVNAQQQKEFLTNYDKAAAEEAKAYPQLQRLADAISTKSMYIDENGKAVPMATFTKKPDDAVATDAAVRAMQQRADALRDGIKTAIRRKYEYAGRLGFGGDTDVESAVQGIEAGKYGAKSPKLGSAPTAPQSAPPASSTAPTPEPAPTQSKPPVQSGPVTVTLPDGKPYTFKDQATLDAFAQKHGLTMSSK